MSLEMVTQRKEHWWVHELDGTQRDRGLRTSREKCLGTLYLPATLGDRIAPAEWGQLSEMENLAWKEASLSASSILSSSFPDFTGPRETDEGNCWGSLSTGWKRISRLRAFRKRVSEFIRNKEQRYCGYCECSGLTSWELTLFSG